MESPPFQDASRQPCIIEPCASLFCLDLLFPSLYVIFFLPPNSDPHSRFPLLGRPRQILAHTPLFGVQTPVFACYLLLFSHQTPQAPPIRLRVTKLFEPLLGTRKTSPPRRFRQHFRFTSRPNLPPTQRPPPFRQVVLTCHLLRGSFLCSPTPPPPRL